MVEDYWDDIDDFDHNEINYILKGSGVYENQPLTKQIISTIFGADRVNSDLDGRLLLDDLEAKLKNSAKPEIEQNQNILLQNFQNQTQNDRQQSSQNRVKTETRTFRPESAMTSEFIDIQSSSNEYDEDLRPSEIPPIAAVLLFALVSVSIAGIISAQGTSFNLAIAFGIALALYVPALMPPAENLQLLAGLTAIGWLVIALSGFLGIDSDSSPEVISQLTDGSFTSLLIISNMIFLCIGVTAYSVVDSKSLIGRRIANNIAVIGLMFMTLAIISDSLDDVLLSATGSIVGLWCITVLGQTSSISLSRLTDLVALLGLVIAMYSINNEWTGNIFVPILFSTLICGSAIIAPNLPSLTLSNLMVAISSFLMIILSLAVNGGYDFAIITHITILAIVLIQLEFRYRQITKQNILVNKILPASSEYRDDVVELNSDIAILGFMQAGKTSFLGALWLLLDNQLTKELWYGSAKQINDPNREINFPINDIKSLIDDPLPEVEKRLHENEDKRMTLIRYLEHRWAPKTLEKQISDKLLPSASEGFPFIARATRKTKEFLQEFIAPLTQKVRENRSLPDSTASVSDQLSLTLEFNAELSQKNRQLFGLSDNEKTFNAVVKNTIKCRDVPGEEVQRVVEELDGLTISSKTLDELLYNIEIGDRRFGSRRQAMLYVVKMTALYEHVIFVVDVDTLTSPDYQEKSPVGAYLMLASNLAKLKGSKLKNLTVLLNKSDVLIGGSEKSNRNMPNGGLNSWSDLLNQDLARETLEEIVGTAEMRSLSIPMDVYFCCTFGGLIHRGDGAEENDFIPTYPMVPVNVLEPLIHNMLNRQQND